MGGLQVEFVNVFAIPEVPFSGNPLAVVTTGWDLPVATMQQWARQFNLSETTFVRCGAEGESPLDGPTADVRIFTPTVELPFAGHPTLGTADVVAAVVGRDEVVLRVAAGDIAVCRTGAGWQLSAPPGAVRVDGTPIPEWAAALGLVVADVPGAAYRVDAGVEQVILQLASPEAVRTARAEAVALRRLGLCPSGEALVYVWAWTGPHEVEARLFFSQGGAVVEDPATGSACANLGTLWAHEGRRNLTVTVSQGAAIERPSRLVIGVGAASEVTVAGHVVRVGSGTLVEP